MDEETNDVQTQEGQPVAPEGGGEEQQSQQEGGDLGDFLPEEEGEESEEGQSASEPEKLIAGRYHSVDEALQGLAELQTAYGRQSEEVGNLRSQINSLQGGDKQQEEQSAQPVDVESIRALATPGYEALVNIGWSKEDAWKFSVAQATAFQSQLQNAVNPLHEAFNEEVAPVAVQRDVASVLSSSDFAGVEGVDQGEIAKTIHASMGSNFRNLDPDTKKEVISLVAYAEIGKQAMNGGIKRSKPEPPSKQRTPNVGTPRSSGGVTNSQINTLARQIIETSQGTITTKDAVRIATGQLRK